MTVLSVMLVLVALALLVIASTTLWWQMHAWLSPVAYESVGFPKLGKARYSFSLIVPCREETEEVMRSTVERLLAQDHPDFEVVFSVGHDDVKPMSNGLNTVQIAEKLARRWPTRVKVSINYDAVKNKPRQLNTSLQDCTRRSSASSMPSP